MRSPSEDSAEDLAGDEALLRRLRVGEDSAFAELVQANIGRMLAVAKRIAKSDGDAEDVVQEAFLSAFEKIDSFDGRARLSTWLHRIVVNAALMRLRSQRARPEQEIEALLPQFEGGKHKHGNAAWQPLAAGDAEQDAVRSEQQQALWRAIEQLPASYRDCVVLRDLEGMESKAVAAQLGISDALVRQRLHRGRQALVKLLSPIMQRSRTPNEAPQ